MILGIDGNEANVPERVGVHMYAFELLWAIYKLQDTWSKNHKIIVYLKEPPKKDLPLETKYFSYRVLPGGKVWIITRLMPSLFFSSPKPDVFFSPSHYIPPFAPMSRVCSIMDLGYLKSSEHFKKYDFWQLKLWSAWSIFFSKKIFAISNSTRDEIVRHYSFAKNKIVVSYLSYNSEKFNPLFTQNDVRRVLDKHSIGSDYLLYLGTLKPSKNIEGLLRGFAALPKKYSKVSLVIAGKKGWLYESIFSLAKELKIDSRIVFTGYLSEDDKIHLIKGARAFVLPSFWEGFGLDVLSSMACGIPVVVSSVGSLPEVAQDAGIYVDPYDISSITTGLETALSLHGKALEKQTKLVLSQARKFSWKNTAQVTMDTLLSIH
jgi:glycosyltransferase involved in cell wall biosynthesis